MRSPAQYFLDRPWVLSMYEDKIHPRFLSRYARRRMNYWIIYQELLDLAEFHRPGVQGELGGATEKSTVTRAIRVLDLGCGTGWFARHRAADLGSENTASITVVGFDLSPNAVAVARRRASEERLRQVTDQRHAEARTTGATLEFRVADILGPLGETSGSVDEIWICGTLHQTGAPGKVLSTISDLLRPGGRVFIQTFAEDPSVNEKVDVAIMERSGHHVFRSGELAELAARAGLRTAGTAHAGLVYFCVLVKGEES